VTVIGLDHPDGDDEVIAGLEKLRGAGAKIAYELVDLADHAAMVAAVWRVEARFGRVTAISHAAGPVPRIALAELTPAVVDDQVRRHTGPLDQLAAAVRAAARRGTGRPGRLRLILTSGSVIGRYGLAGEAVGALVTGALADFGQQLAAVSPGCQALHLDWPAWAGTGLGERADLAEQMAQAGFTPMPVAEGSRQLLKLLAADALPARAAVHGRVGVPAPRPIAAAAVATGQGRNGEPTSARFVERVLVHYPAVELIAEASLSLLSDPYLGDYRVDGRPVLPPTMALEAMAQAASVLAGTPARWAGEVAMHAPIVLPAGKLGSQTVIRLCAVRDGDSVTVLVRSDTSDFAVEHCRAVFSVAKPEPASALLAVSPQEANPRDQAAEAVFGSELYGSVCFQTGRFSRLATVRMAGSRAAIGLAEAADELPWFGAVPPARASARQRLVLGSAGLGDATLQLIQACVPHRRLMLGSCEEVAFSGRHPEGLVTIRAVRQSPPGPVWNIDATDSDGHLLIAWRGLRMRDAGPLQPPGGRMAGAAGTAGAAPSRPARPARPAQPVSAAAATLAAAATAAPS
jgi:enediyne polyketide synthase